MRFQKMLSLEQQSILDYQDLLKECQTKHKGELQVQAHLKKLIVGEKKHAKLVKELLNIVSHQQD